MSEPKYIPITPSVLTWFIEDGCVDRIRLCNRMAEKLDNVEWEPGNQGYERLEAFERGDIRPTANEWRALAEVLRRPTAAFFLPSKAVEERMQEAMKTYDFVEDLIQEAVEKLLLLVSGREEK